MYVIVPFKKGPTATLLHDEVDVSALDGRFRLGWTFQPWMDVSALELFLLFNIQFS